MPCLWREVNRIVVWWLLIQSGLGFLREILLCIRDDSRIRDIVQRKRYQSRWIHLREAIFERYEIITALRLKIQALWNVVSCRLINSYRCFEGSWYLLLQGQAVIGSLDPPETLNQSTKLKNPEKTGNFRARRKLRYKVDSLHSVWCDLF
jgi:hypothetical protein